MTAIDCHAVVTQRPYAVTQRNFRLHQHLRPLNIRCAASFGNALRLLCVSAMAVWIGAVHAQPMPRAATQGAIELRLGDFFRMPVGPAGLELSDSLRQANGHAVRLVGFMVQQEAAAPGRFMLAPRPVQMSEHADGDADDLPPATVHVYLDPGQRDWMVPHVRGLVAVSGKLSVGRYEEMDGRVSWVRLQLGPDATRGINASESRHDLHDAPHPR